MTPLELLNTIFVQPPDVAVLKFLIFILLAAVLMLIVPTIPAFKDNARAGRLVGLIIALIATIGMSNNYVVGIITGYSWTIIILFILLPIIGIAFLLSLKGEGPGVSFLKIIVSGTLLFAISSFHGMIENFNVDYLSLGQNAGITLNDIFGIVIFIVMIVLFYYIFELISRAAFASGGSVSPRF